MKNAILNLVLTVAFYFLGIGVCFADTNVTSVSPEIAAQSSIANFDIRKLVAERTQVANYCVGPGSYCGNVDCCAGSYCGTDYLCH